MKKIILLVAIASTLLISCTKYVSGPINVDPEEWMQTHERGSVVYTDHFSGYYVIETSRGYSVVESLGGIMPYDFDTEYAYFSNRGIQDIYNRSGNYFTQGRIIDSWLSWQQAMYLMDQLSYK